jgi:uncharacterized protein
MVGIEGSCDARGNEIEHPCLPRGTTVTCTNCGATLESTATTCTVCGASLRDEPRSDQPTDQRWSPNPGAAQPAGTSGGQAGDPQLGRGQPGGTWSPPPGGAPPAWGQAAPHPSGLPSDVRNWGLAAHLSAYVGAWILLAFVGPLVVWLLKRDEHPFIEHHAKEALNFNISFLLYGIVGTVIAVPLGLFTLGIGLIPLGIAALILVGMWLIFPILAAIKAANGEGYRYPLTIRFVS